MVKEQPSLLKVKQRSILKEFLLGLAETSARGPLAEKDVSKRD